MEELQNTLKKECLISSRIIRIKYTNPEGVSLHFTKLAVSRLIMVRFEKFEIWHTQRCHNYDTRDVTRKMKSHEVTDLVHAFMATNIMACHLLLILDLFRLWLQQVLKSETIYSLGKSSRIKQIQFILSKKTLIP